MFFMQMNEIDKYNETINKKYALFEKIGKNKHCSISKMFKTYTNLCVRVNNSQIILDFEKTKLLPFIFDDAHLKKMFRYIKEETISLDSRNEKLDDKINNVLMTKNNASSMKIAIVALVVSALSAAASIATIIITLFRGC